MRELILQGPCRYTDLKDALPGIATNLLAERLRVLETAGLIWREDAAPPVATTLFRLTAAGSELEPVLTALGAWGIRYMAEPSDRDEFRSHWFAFPVSLFLRDHAPDGPPVAIELRSAGGPVDGEVAHPRVPDPDQLAAAQHLRRRSRQPDPDMEVGLHHQSRAIKAGTCAAPHVRMAFLAGRPAVRAEPRWQAVPKHLHGGQLLLLARGREPGYACRVKVRV